MHQTGTSADMGMHTKSGNVEDKYDDYIKLGLPEMALQFLEYKQKYFPMQPGV